MKAVERNKYRNLKVNISRPKKHPVRKAEKIKSNSNQ
jgi:hypothetical protein